MDNCCFMNIAVREEFNGYYYHYIPYGGGLLFMFVIILICCCCMISATEIPPHGYYYDCLCCGPCIHCRNFRHHQHHLNPVVYTNLQPLSLNVIRKFGNKYFIDASEIMFIEFDSQKNEKAF
uniref:Uncharacterized protein n=1 Tax=Onchocerca volvulus TaxID=6282 RepID=A0A8R1XUR4_ONCVO